MRAPRFKKLLFGLTLLIALIIAGILGPPALFLARVWLNDSTAALPVPPVGTNDASRLNATRPAEIIGVATDPAGIFQNSFSTAYGNPPAITA